MKDYKYRFTVISAVYNVAPFLREAVDSIIKQSIGIKNIQLILVDDGTPDNSGEICDEYAAKYPDNIFVIHKQNGGVSSARNEGLKQVRGKYVNFMDSDDKWDTSTFKRVWQFFEENNHKTDLVALPIRFFDAARGGHMLNYKFAAGSRVVDLKREWDAPQMHVASTFIRAEALKGIEFDQHLAYAEDSKVVQQVVLKKQTLGLLNEGAYLYRKRSTGEASAMQSSGQKPNWYIPVMESYHTALIREAVDRCGALPRFLQMTLMYDLQWRLKKETVKKLKTLSEAEKTTYLELLRSTLGYIDDDIITAQRYVDGEQKLLALEMKHGRPAEVSEDGTGLAVTVNGGEKFPLENCSASIDFFEPETENELSLTATVGLYNYPYASLEFFFLVDGKRVEPQNNFDGGSLFCLDSEKIKRHTFTATLSLDKKQTHSVRLGAMVNGREIVFKRLSFGRYAPLSNRYSNSFSRIQGRLLCRTADSLLILPDGILRALGREVRLLIQIFKNDGALGIGAAGLRVMMKLYRLFKIRPLWLISDRASLGGDNGEALFRYLRQNHKNIDARFVLLADSPDFARLSAYGRVIKKDSAKHKLLSLAARYIISSHGEFEIYNPLRSRVEAFRDMWCRVRFVFLQHGITQNDISGWIGKANKNFYGIVSTAEPEYKAFFRFDYRYTEKNLWLTGFPRFDRLYDSGEKTVTIMPTWRKYLTSGFDAATDIWGIVPDFAESDYYAFYNGLINHPHLLKRAKELGYKICFFPHPAFQPHVDIFNKAEGVEFLPAGTLYREVYAKSSLLLTDYSSAAFDFSYLRKPVIYTHFDKEEFFGGSHIADGGYFEHERDGFGEVEYDLASTVERIIEYMENGCQLKDKYRERIDGFFAFNDQGNCERLYKKLIDE